MLNCVQYRCYKIGMIQPGDELRQVNGVEVTGKQPDDVIQLIVSKFRHEVFCTCHICKCHVHLFR